MSLNIFLCPCANCIWRRYQEKCADDARKKNLGIKSIAQTVRMYEITDHLIDFEITRTFTEEDVANFNNLADESIPIYSTDKIQQKRCGGMGVIGYISMRPPVKTPRSHDPQH